MLGSSSCLLNKDAALTVHVSMEMKSEMPALSLHLIGTPPQGCAVSHGEVQGRGGMQGRLCALIPRS